MAQHMSPISILLLENIHTVAEEAFKAAGIEVKRVAGSLKEDDLIKHLEGVQMVGIRSKTHVTKKVLESPQAKDLIAVGAFCIGTNQIDLEAAAHLGICVFNAPFSNTRSVAELILSEIVMLSRHLGDRNMEIHRGTWKKVATSSHEVRGKTLGVVGYGHIGSQVGVLAEFFGMRVLYYDIATKLPLSNNTAVPTLESLLEQSDFVTLHVPETPQTRNMITAEALKHMKKGACLLNASRGTVVDLDALADALKSGHLGGAAVDVYPEEPESNIAEGFKSVLQGLPNVVLTPHIGGSTAEAQENIGREVSTSLTRYATMGTSVGSVNFPWCELAPGPATHRLVHVHENVPGVLRDINKIIGDSEANIHAQYLSTTPDIGYLIMDLDAPFTEQVTAQLLKLPHTIKARALS